MTLACTAASATGPRPSGVAGAGVWDECVPDRDPGLLADLAPLTSVAEGVAERDVRKVADLFVSCAAESPRPLILEATRATT